MGMSALLGERGLMVGVGCMVGMRVFLLHTIVS